MFYICKKISKILNANKITLTVDSLAEITKIETFCENLKDNK